MAGTGTGEMVETEPLQKATSKALGRHYRRLQSAKRELLRRAILDQWRIDLLITDVLGYELQPFHRELLHFQNRKAEIAAMFAPRGFGKSTVLTIARAVFEILCNPNARGLIVSNTQAQAEVPLREIKAHLEQNATLRAVFGDWVNRSGRWTDREIVVNRRTRIAKESTLTALGVGGPAPGRHYDWILADDLVDEENSWTAGQREKLRTWVYKVMEPTLRPGGWLCYVGTRYHPLDFYGHLLTHEAKTRHLIVPALTVDPDGDESDYTTPWPERFSVAALLAKRDRLGSAIFNAQYQNDTEQMKGSLFQGEWFRYYDEMPDADPDKGRTIETWVGCDPAATKAAMVGKDRAASDFWTIAVVSRVLEDGEPSREVYVREVWRGRVTKQDYLNRLRAINERYAPRAVAIETVAAQEYLAQDAERFMPVQRVDRTTDKVSRAYWLQPFFENRQVCFPSKAARRGDPDTWRALESELLLFPDAEHDDLFDALQTALSAAMSPRGVGVMVL